MPKCYNLSAQFLATTCSRAIANSSGLNDRPSRTSFLGVATLYQGSILLVLIQRNLFPISRFIEYRGPSDANSMRLDDGKAASQARQFRLANELQNEFVDCQRSHAARPKQDNPGMRSGRKFSKVRKVEVESEDHAIFTLGAAPTSTSTFPSSPSSPAVEAL